MVGVRITRFIPALLAVGVTVTGCEPGSITEAREELQDGPARTLQLSLPVARDTFIVDSVLADFVDVTTITLSDGLLALELDVGGLTGPVSGVAYGPVTFPVEGGVVFDATDLDLGGFEDAVRDATLNTAFAAVTVVNQADVPATLSDFLVGVVRYDTLAGDIDRVAGQPDWQTDAGGAPIQVSLGGGTFDIPPGGTAVDTLYSAALVDRLVDMVLGGEYASLVGEGDVIVGDGTYVASIGGSDSVEVALKPVIGFDFTLPPAGVGIDSSVAEKGLDLEPDNADDMAARTDSAVVSLDFENFTSLSVEATVIIVADSLADAYSAPPADQVPLDVVTVSPGQVDANGRVTQATNETTGVILTGAQARAFMDEWFTAGIRLRLLPPPGGRSAIGTGDWVGLNASVTIYVRTGGTP
jgi:hypothetical protein